MSIETDETSTILIADGSFAEDEDWLKDLSAVPTCQGDYCLPSVTIGGKDRDSGSPTQTAAGDKLLPPPPPEDDDAIDFYDLYGDGDGNQDKAEGAGATESGNEGSEGGTEKKQQWIDGGQFTADEQGRIRKTVSEDGTKVREFNYTGSDPNQITEITIDGNRFYKRGALANEWHYFVDGQFRGIWRGDVDMQKNGLYGYTASKDNVTHEFGSARQEIRSYKRGDDQPAPLPQPDDNLRKPDGNGEGDKTSPDGERPPVEIKEKYGTADAAEAVRVASEAGLPLVVHVGANFCGPCRTMERDVWPTIEHELKGQAVFLHVIAEEVEAGAGGELASQIGSMAGSYPTILVASASQTNGKPSISEQQRASTMNLQQTRAFLTNARARWRK
jgi:hypothetical protein